MGRADFLDLGDWNAACYFCGRKRKASDLRRYWKGFYVCKEEWEPRQPQDFVKGIPDIQTPSWVQDQSDTYITTPVTPFFCTPIGNLGTADFGTADCMTLTI